MKRIHLFALTFAVVLASACTTTEVYVEPARSWTALGGSVAATDLDEDGSLRASTMADLGLAGRESSNRLSLRWSQGTDRWELFGYSMDSTARGKLAADLHLGGEDLFEDEGDVDTDLHLGVYGIRWVKSVVQRGALEVGVGASLVVLEFDLDFDQDVLDPDTGVPTGEHKSTGDDAVLPFPLPMVDLNYHHESFDARLSLAGMWIWVDQRSGYLIDLDFSVRTAIFDEFGELVCGYHSLELELEDSGGDESVRLDLALTGPYLGLRFGF